MLAGSRRTINNNCILNYWQISLQPPSWMMLNKSILQNHFPNSILMKLIKYLSSHREVTIYVDIRENKVREVQEFLSQTLSKKKYKWRLDKFPLCLADFSFYNNFNVLIHMASLRIITGKKHPQIKLQHLWKVWVWTFG